MVVGQMGDTPGLASIVFAGGGIVDFDPPTAYRAAIVGCAHVRIMPVGRAGRSRRRMWCCDRSPGPEVEARAQRTGLECTCRNADHRLHFLARAEGGRAGSWAIGGGGARPAHRRSVSSAPALRIADRYVAGPVAARPKVLRRSRDFARQRWPFGQLRLTRGGWFRRLSGCPATSSACGIRIW